MNIMVVATVLEAACLRATLQWRRKRSPQLRQKCAEHDKPDHDRALIIHLSLANVTADNLI